jgi:Uma2 family endonuclease
MTTDSHSDRPFTAEDFAKLPPDELRFEVMAGELFEVPTPPVIHQFILGRLLMPIHEYLENGQLGIVFGMRFDVHLSQYDILKPDISVVLREHRSRIHDHGVVGPPDLVVEILAPSSVTIDRVRKVAIYAAFGVPEYWIVDPEAATIVAQTLLNGRFHPIRSDDKLIHSLQLPGLVIDPSEIFALPERLQAAFNR